MNSWFHQHSFPRPRQDSRQQRLLQPEEIWAITREPMLRWPDVPCGELLAAPLMVEPEDPVLQELFGLTAREQMAKAMISEDPYHGNYPPGGEMPVLVPGRIPLLTMPTGDVLSADVAGLTKNILVVGPTGGGKTNWLRVLIGAVISGNVKVTLIAFDRKGDLVDCKLLANPSLPIVVLHWHELMLAMLQPVPGMALNVFINVFVQLLAAHLNLFASRRLMLETMHLLYKRKRSSGVWPTLCEWIDLIDKIRANAASRLGQYREALLYSLKQITNEFGNVVNYASSNFMEKLFKQHGCFVINTSGLSVEMASLLASLFVFWVYEKRGLPNTTVGHPVVFVLDDALPLVKGSTASESEGGINPLSTWAFMGRSRGIGFVVSAQNFSLISPALRNNADSLLCFGSYGRDAEELGRHLNLTNEQQALLPLLRPGECVAIARSVWPLAVYGRVPEVL